MKLDVNKCNELLTALQRAGADLIGTGVRKPSGTGLKGQITLCRMGDVEFRFEFKGPSLITEIGNEARAEDFRKVLELADDVNKKVDKLQSPVLQDQALNPDVVNELADAYNAVLKKLTTADGAGRSFLYKKMDWRKRQFETSSDCIETVERLNQSLLFAMSHGSHELFHTNVWAWLVRRHHEFAKVFFDDIDVEKIVGVEREQGNRDLTIWVDESGVRKAYVVENKFKSSAREEQLKQYQDKLAVKNEFKAGLLVTLDKLPIGFSLPLGWGHMLQQDVVKKVAEVAKTGAFACEKEMELVLEYANITSQMAELFAQYRKAMGERWALALNHSEWDDSGEGDLEAIRLADIFKKMNASDFKTYIETLPRWKELDAELREIGGFEPLRVRVDFLHKLPVVDCAIVHKDPDGHETFIGTILQGNSLGRCACSFDERWNDGKNDGPKMIYEKLKDIWFDDEAYLRHGLCAIKKSAKKRYKQYDTDEYSFAYQDILIERDDFEYLAEVICDNIKTAIGKLRDGQLNDFFGV